MLLMLCPGTKENVPLCFVKVHPCTCKDTKSQEFYNFTRLHNTNEFLIMPAIFKEKLGGLQDNRNRSQDLQ